MEKGKRSVMSIPVSCPQIDIDFCNHTLYISIASLLLFTQRVISHSILILNCAQRMTYLSKSAYHVVLRRIFNNKFNCRLCQVGVRGLAISHCLRGYRLDVFLTLLSPLTRVQYRHIDSRCQIPPSVTVPSSSISYFMTSSRTKVTCLSFTRILLFSSCLSNCLPRER